MADPLTLSLRITHQMAVSKTFFVFQEAPKVVDGPAAKIFSNVFSVNPPLTGNPDGSVTTKFSWQLQYYAVIGTVGGDEHNVVTNSAWKKVSLGPGGSIVHMTGENKGANWKVPDVDTKDFSGVNGFKLVTDDKFEVDGPNAPYIGVGMVDPKSGEVTPLQTFQAVPTLGSSLYPKLTYYVTVGEYLPGQFVDKKDVGQFMKIDYQYAQGERIANLVYDGHGNFSQDPAHKSSNGIALERGGVL